MDSGQVIQCLMGSGHVVFSGQWPGRSSAGSEGNGHVLFNGQWLYNDEWTTVI